MRERPRWRESLVGDDALDSRGFVDLAKRSLAELGFVEGAPAGPVRPMCHLVKNGAGAWIEASFASRAGRELASILASASGTPVWLIEAVARNDGSMRAARHQEVEVTAERIGSDASHEPFALEPLPSEFATREGPEGGDPKILAEHFARDALRWAWAKVRTTPTHSRVTLGRWTPPRAGFRRVEGVTDPVEAAFRTRIMGAKERSIVEGVDGRPTLRLVLPDGSRQLRALSPRELVWARKVLG